MTYRIVRFYQAEHLMAETITEGLTLEQAQAHCNDPQSSSQTATGEHAQARTKMYGAWFDGYEEDRDVRNP